MELGTTRNTKLRAAAATMILCLSLAACNPLPADESAAIERNILATPGQQELFRTIKQEYPQDFAALVAEIETLDPVQRNNDAWISQVGSRWLQRFFRQISPDAVRAPEPQLLEWSAAEHRLYATLQREAVEQCAGMTMGQWITVDPSIASATEAISRRNAAMVRAAAAGKADPQDYPEPDEAAFARFGSAIAATGLDPQQQAALASDEKMQALDPDQQCAIGVAVYQGLSGLPDDVEPVMAAYVLAPDQ